MPILPPDKRPGPKPKTIPNLVILPASMVASPPADPPPKVDDLFTPPPEYEPTGNGFEPTMKQRQFLLVVQDQVLNGETHPVRWVQVFNATPGRPRMEVSEFRKWKLDRKFAAWFYGEITYEPDEHDRKLMSGEVEKRIMDGVKVGDARLIKEAVDVFGKRKRAVHDKPTSVGEELQRFREAGDRGHVARPKHGLSMDDEASG